MHVALVAEGQTNRIFFLSTLISRPTISAKRLMYAAEAVRERALPFTAGE